MARAIDKRIMLDLIIEAKKTDPETGPFSEWLAEYLVDHLPTLTPPDEPLTCEGCIHEEKEHQNCNYCMRASYLGDYYYRRPPEGEEDK